MGTLSGESLCHFDSCFCFPMGANSYRKEFAPIGAYGSKFFPSRVDPILIGIVSQEVNRNSQKLFPFYNKNGGKAWRYPFTSSNYQHVALFCLDCMGYGIIVYFVKL